MLQRLGHGRAKQALLVQGVQHRDRRRQRAELEELTGKSIRIEQAQAALTGHLVLSTLHTNSASSTINRIIDVFPAHQQSQIRTQLSLVHYHFGSKRGLLLAVLDEAGLETVLAASAAETRLALARDAFSLAAVLPESKSGEHR